MVVRLAPAHDGDKCDDYKDEDDSNDDGDRVMRLIGIQNHVLKIKRNKRDLSDVILT